MEPCSGLEPAHPLYKGGAPPSELSRHGAVVWDRTRACGIRIRRAANNTSRACWSLVGPENFEISTLRLRAGCSASELRTQTGALTWDRTTASSIPRRRHYHWTIRAGNWWRRRDSNPRLLLARQLLSRLSYIPNLNLHGVAGPSSVTLRLDSAGVLRVSESIPPIAMS